MIILKDDATENRATPWHHVAAKDGWTPFDWGARRLVRYREKLNVLSA